MDKSQNHDHITLTHISNFMEGILDSNSHEAQHIAQCAECQKKIQKLKQIDHMTREYLTAQHPVTSDADMAQIIRQRIQSTTMTPQLFFRRYIFQMAASVALVLSLATVAWNYMGQKNATEPLTLPETDDTAFITTIPTPTTTPHSIIPLSDVQTVSFNGLSSFVSGQNFIAETIPNDIPSPVTIPNTVNHIWVVNTPNDVQKLIKHANEKFKTEKINTDGVNLKMRGNYLSGGTAFKVQGTCLSIVQLVRDFNAMGANLISSSTPQPEDSCFTNKAESPVIYSVEILLPENPIPNVIQK